MTAAIPSGPLPSGFIGVALSNLVPMGTAVLTGWTMHGTVVPPLGGWGSSWYWCSGYAGIIGLEYHGAWSDPLDDQAVILCSQVTS